MLPCFVAAISWVITALLNFNKTPENTFKTSHHILLTFIVLIIVTAIKMYRKTLKIMQNKTLKRKLVKNRISKRVIVSIFSGISLLEFRNFDCNCFHIKFFEVKWLIISTLIYIYIYLHIQITYIINWQQYCWKKDCFTVEFSSISFFFTI